MLPCVGDIPPFDCGIFDPLTRRFNTSRRLIKLSSLEVSGIECARRLNELTEGLYCCGPFSLPSWADARSQPLRRTSLSETSVAANGSPRSLDSLANQRRDRIMCGTLNDRLQCPLRD